MSKPIILSILVVLLFLSSCTYHNEETEYPTPAGCDTLNMSYTNDILPIFKSNGCAGCHGSSSTTKLNSYTNTKISVDNGSLLGSINHKSGFRPMPDFSPKINQCSIDQITAWINDGAFDN
ncbi:MAG: hypothetical protein COA58_12795 [Bacteroidetes bacterium]|nr:MAG: hypothetical protein COA58_12795 [Bacteroidota bacterium]